LALSLAALDHRVDSRQDVELRDIAHALNARMGARGWVWLSSRTLTRVVLRRGATRVPERIQELIDSGEFYRVTARGRGHGKGRTLYFKGWANRLAVLSQLQEQWMPLDAIHAAERAFADHRRRISFFSRTNVTPGWRHSLLHGGGPSEKDGRKTPDRPIRASHGPPRQPPTANPKASTSQPYRLLAKHGLDLRRLRDALPPPRDVP
jgi:hypothetical protein